MDLMSYIKSCFKMYLLDEKSLNLVNQRNLFSLSMLTILGLYFIHYLIAYASVLVNEVYASQLKFTFELLGMGYSDELLPLFLFIIQFSTFLILLGVIGIMNLLFKLFKGKGDFKLTALATFSALIPISIASVFISIVSVLLELLASSIITFILQIIVSFAWLGLVIWEIVIVVQTLSRAHQLSHLKVVLLLISLFLLAIIVMFLVAFIIMFTFFMPEAGAQLY